MPQRSSPEKSSFFFVYQVNIENMGNNTVQLRSRCWNITDANGKLNTVRCDIVPLLALFLNNCASSPNASFVAPLSLYFEISQHAAGCQQLRANLELKPCSELCPVCRGPGVVGKYPILGPGTSFQYTSACPLTTPTGVMEGSYDFLLLDCGDEELKSVPLSVAVAPFLLSTSVVGNINIDDK